MTSEEWVERDRRWRRKLGRLKLGVEPLAEQLERYRRVTWALTVVPGIIGLMFLALFTAFRAPGTGAIVAGVLLLPIPLLAWLDYARLVRRVARYEEERRAYTGSAGE